MNRSRFPLTFSGPNKMYLSGPHGGVRYMFCKIGTVNICIIALYILQISMNVPLRLKFAMLMPLAQTMLVLINASVSQDIQAMEQGALVRLYMSSC